MKAKIKLNAHFKKTLSDMHTPVELYLKLRDKYHGNLLLESSDYKNRNESYSYLCLESISSIQVREDETTISFPSASSSKLATKNIDVADTLQEYLNSFEINELPIGVTYSGAFGFTSYDAIPLFEEIEFNNKRGEQPLLEYHVFRFVIIFNHFNNELFIIENLLPEQSSEIDQLLAYINNRSVPAYNFKADSAETSNFEDEKFLEIIKKGKDECQYGNVFQVVLSRKFQQTFSGDEFNVYRALRSINPSPYLFYFDFGDYKIFGSSPEAQLIIKDGKSVINPIAGTFKRTGNILEDEKAAQELLEDPKENAEHVMLVDLARNDLSKSGSKVTVERFKKVEYYSHVIHLVSKVTSELEEDYNPVKILGETYPAGTLSGAPKHKAMSIIDDLEPDARGFYGGTIGMYGFNGEVNHAIFIRSFLSHNKVLTYQAGAGITINSVPDSELQEVNNKIGALRKAIKYANEI